MSAEKDRELRATLIDAFRALEDKGIDALVVGGVALSYHLDGEARVDHDVDLFIAEADVDQAMTALGAAGFEVTDTHPTWLFKARRNGTLADVLYRLGRHFKLDEDMLERSIVVPVDGVPMPFISREDLAVGQAGAAKPEVPGHWFQAIELLSADEVDWDYVSRRARIKPHLRAALLNYARHLKVEVPDDLL